MIEPIRYRVRFRLSVEGGTAIEDVDGLYIRIDEHEAHVAEAARLLTLALDCRPHSFTETQRCEARLWLAGVP